MLDERRQADDELAEALDRRDPLERREAVDRDAVGVEGLDLVLDRDEVILESGGLRVDADQLEPAVGLERLEVDAPAQGVAEELVVALLEGEEQRALAGLRAAAEELGGEQGLARPGGARDQDDRVAEEAAAASPARANCGG